MLLLTKGSTSLIGSANSIRRVEPASIAFWSWRLKRPGTGND
jgi:hypothetical protein